MYHLNHFVPGAFLLPYVIMLAIVGLPIFYFELCFGQFSSLGPIRIWLVSPLSKGTLSMHSLLHRANERRRCFVTTSLIGWVQSQNQPCYGLRLKQKVRHFADDIFICMLLNENFYI